MVQKNNILTKKNKVNNKNVDFIFFDIIQLSVL